MLALAGLAADEQTLPGLLFNGATIYPQSIAMASTWDPELIHMVATELADEASSVGLCQAAGAHRGCDSRATLGVRGGGLRGGSPPW